MIVFRFEDENGEGPYAQNEHYFHFVERHNNNIKKYPLAKFDRTFNREIPKEEELQNFVYGFESIQQAKKWFNSENISDMYDVQMFCFSYEVKQNSEIYISDKQVLFKKSDIKNVEFIEESELLSKRFIEKRDRLLGY